MTFTCLYVTQGWGVHDERWVGALRACGADPHVVRTGIDVADSQELRVYVAKVASPSTPILAGPLDTITRYLLGVDAPLIGLSWGYDIFQLQQADDLQWLTHLDGLIVDSPATFDIAATAGVAEEDLTLLPWGIDLERFQPNGPKFNTQQWGLPPDAKIVMSLRAHEPMYRIADIIEAFARISSEYSNIYLVIGHSGSMTSILEDLAHSRGIASRTRFIGTVPESELAPLLRAADVYVSASEVDGTSVTLLQAMACKVPVLVSETPGNQAWVEPEVTGRTFTTGDSDDLVREFRAVFNSATQSLASLTEAARRRVQADADWPANRGRLCSVLRE